MKYLHLIWAALFRRKTRTILTLLSITMAFLLFGLLDAVRVSFAEAGQSANGAERLQTGAKLSFIQPLPKSLQARIAQVPGVKDVAHADQCDAGDRTATAARCPREAVDDERDRR